MQSLNLAAKFTIALAFSISTSNSTADTPVEVMGHLQVFNEEQQLCNEIRGQAVLQFFPNSENLSFDAQTDRFDMSCKWKAKGALYRGTADLQIKAALRGFRQFRPRKPIEIREINSQDDFIKREGIRVILYTRDRFGREVLARAHNAVGRNEISQAIEYFDMAFENNSDPETLFLKADTLDVAQRHADAAIAWRQVVDMVTREEAVDWPRTGDVHWRLTTSLYRAAKASAESGPEKWLCVTESASEALKSPWLAATRRSEVIGIWLDCLFKAAASRGEYRKLSESVLDEAPIRDSWKASISESSRTQVRQSACRMMRLCPVSASLKSSWTKKHVVLDPLTLSHWTTTTISRPHPW